LPLRALSVVLAVTWSAAVAEPVPADVVRRYEGRMELSRPEGRSCFPDMQGAYDVELLLRRAGATFHGYFTVRPGFAVPIRSVDGSDVWSIPTQPVGTTRSPFFSPKQIRAAEGDGRWLLSVEWGAYADCQPEVTTVTLTRALDDSTAPAQFARYNMRDALTQALRTAPNPLIAERAGTQLFEWLNDEFGLSGAETIEVAAELAKLRLGSGKEAAWDPLVSVKKAIEQQPPSTPPHSRPSLAAVDRRPIPDRLLPCRYDLPVVRDVR
jgi:hypothetical protein